MEEQNPKSAEPQKKKILFLCTGNAARSQMAEAIARSEHGDVFDPVSAGSRPTGWVHPLAIKAMEDLGVSMDAARSKSADEFAKTPFDLVVTVCDSAAKDCPSWPHAARVEHWSIEDPSYGPDDPSTRYDRFLETREDLRRRIGELAESVAREEKSGSR
jgi:arsenate reductase (thioredoxin)